ncbi:divergent protein kinase domain 1C isoform X1 [Neodiprion pinetum]|uniref:divergent protein kinase domain 1C isoform X1 n=1 Tax=Neodiprion fabricii TaxID=2872261 RepID=UPI001ED94BB9|nr:divergent protein kinase domain 1C isoform X1 [Neodiprion fabricii]XP_046485474.1 divergent protein kinase domain 1C isoform X1 [Neodiprion pinetum]XP_046621792.1 divergent protein kinase domain 1C isoform X1 [Neodiprion virginianus]
MNIKRLPGFIIHYKLVSVAAFLVLASIVYLLIHWGIMCTNLEAWRHVSKVCSLHSSGTAAGILCGPLCSEKRIHSLACETLHAGKEAVFSAHWETTRLVFKASRIQSNPDQSESLFWTDTAGIKHFPSEEEFADMIRDLITNNLNLTITGEQLKRLSRLRRHHVETNPTRRNLEMENVWPLLQENEYILSILYEDRDVFPQLIGTCGTFFAVEYVKPIQTPTGVLALSDSKPEWAKSRLLVHRETFSDRCCKIVTRCDFSRCRRLKLAVMILDLLEEFDSNFVEPFHLCDVKINHFGLPPGGQRLKFLDLDAVFSKTALTRLLADGRSCEKHEDCDFFDCRSFCSSKQKCESPVVNNNLQIICEKIFLGWTLSGTIIIPGLLMSQHTTSTLAVMLRQCANPAGDVTNLPRAAVPDSLKSRLYNMLSEMEQQFSTPE